MPCTNRWVEGGELARDFDSGKATTCSLSSVQLEPATLLSSPYYLLLVSPQRVLDVLYKHKCQAGFAQLLPAAQPATFEPGEDTICSQQMHLLGRGAAATLTYDVQSVKLEPGVMAQHDVEMTLFEAAAVKLTTGNAPSHEAEPSVSVSSVVLSPVTIGGLASVSEVLKNPDDAAAVCIQVMCDFEEGPAQVTHSPFYPTQNQCVCVCLRVRVRVRER